MQSQAEPHAAASLPLRVDGRATLEDLPGTGEHPDPIWKKKHRWETRDNEQKSHECEERSNLDNIYYPCEHLTGSGDI